MTKYMTRFIKDESGATAIEYGLIAALIGVFLVTALGLLGGALDAKFNEAASELAAA